MSEAPIFERIREDVSDNEVVLFMKGTPVFPQCGFSAAVVQALSNLGVLRLREGIKQFSNWPTVPQLYIKGEFVGGCDIVREMYESGELIEYLNTNGVERQMANPE